MLTVSFYNSILASIECWVSILRKTLGNSVLLGKFLPRLKKLDRDDHNC